MAKIVTLGEIMLRLSTKGNTRFVQVDNFEACYGGGEANVAISVANYGHDAYFVSKLYLYLAIRFSLEVFSEVLMDFGF